MPITFPVSSASYVLFPPPRLHSLSFLDPILSTQAQNPGWAKPPASQTLLSPLHSSPTPSLRTCPTARGALSRTMAMAPYVLTFPLGMHLQSCGEGHAKHNERHDFAKPASIPACACVLTSYSLFSNAVGGRLGLSDAVSAVSPAASPACGAFAGVR